jgi:hypothetical protein
MLPLRMTHPAAMAVSAAASTGPGQRLGWSVVSGLSGVAAAVGTKKLLTAAVDAHHRPGAADQPGRP